jgi:glycosyltransferase involved in cell wall biosynthesis
MALGIPTIMSPVGVNSEIITDGENGFLAAHADEWVEKLSLLIEHTDLATRMGKAARDTVVSKYSVHAVKHLYLQLFHQVLAG